MKIEYQAVEDISLPIKYQSKSTRLPLNRLYVLYEELKEDHLKTLRQMENIARGSWANERMIESQVDLIITLQMKVNRLERLGQYRPGKRPKLSTVDEPVA